jgi:hypothetical protein
VGESGCAQSLSGADFGEAVANEEEATGGRVALHGATEGMLGFFGEFVNLVKDEDLEGLGMRVKRF